jgi:hypothetical protein
MRDPRGCKYSPEKQMARLKVGRANLFAAWSVDHKNLHECDAIDKLLDWSEIEVHLSSVYSRGKYLTLQS